MEYTHHPELYVVEQLGCARLAPLLEIRRWSKLAQLKPGYLLVVCLQFVIGDETLIRVVILDIIVFCVWFCVRFSFIRSAGVLVLIAALMAQMNCRYLLLCIWFPLTFTIRRGL